jgi:hypothetical protein
MRKKPKVPDVWEIPGTGDAPFMYDDDGNKIIMTEDEA